MCVVVNWGPLGFRDGLSAPGGHVVLGRSQLASVSPGCVIQVGAILVGLMGEDSLSGDASVASETYGREVRVG